MTPTTVSTASSEVKPNYVTHSARSNIQTVIASFMRSRGTTGNGDTLQKLPGYINAAMRVLDENSAPSLWNDSLYARVARSLIESAHSVQVREEIVISNALLCGEGSSGNGNRRTQEVQARLIGLAGMIVIKAPELQGDRSARLVSSDFVDEALDKNLIRLPEETRSTVRACLALMTVHLPLTMHSEFNTALIKHIQSALDLATAEIEENLKQHPRSAQLRFASALAENIFKLNHERARRDTIELLAQSPARTERLIERSLEVTLIQLAADVIAEAPEYRAE